ncbi:MAG: MBL fold metallo-hydrolase [Gemmataceae bacterium]
MVGCDCADLPLARPAGHRYRCGVLLRVPQGASSSTPRGTAVAAAPRRRRGDPRRPVHPLPRRPPVRPRRPAAGRLACWADRYRCTAPGDTEGKIRTAFSYAFGPEAERLSAGYIPKLHFERIDTAPFRVLGEQVVPIPLVHAHFPVLGFRVRDVAYCTDVNEIPRSSWPLLEGLDVLILDALRFKPHPGHFSVDQALDVIDQFQPRHAYLTHLSHEIDHAAVSGRLPRGLELAHDGLSFPF